MTNKPLVGDIQCLVPVADFPSDSLLPLTRTASSSLTLPFVLCPSLFVTTTFLSLHATLLGAPHRYVRLGSISECNAHFFKEDEDHFLLAECRQLPRQVDVGPLDRWNTFVLHVSSVSFTSLSPRALHFGAAWHHPSAQAPSTST